MKHTHRISLTRCLATLGVAALAAFSAPAIAEKADREQPVNIEADRLTAQGFGETRPAEKGTTKEAREANRRVEFIINDQ